MVLFRINQRKLQLASEAPGALAWKLCLRGPNLTKKRKSPRVNLTTGITAHQQADKRRKRSKLTIKDASAEQLDALCRLRCKDACFAYVIPGVERCCLINYFRGCIFYSQLAPRPSFLCLLVFSTVIPVVVDISFFFLSSAHAC